MFFYVVCKIFYGSVWEFVVVGSYGNLLRYKFFDFLLESGNVYKEEVENWIWFEIYLDLNWNLDLLKEYKNSYIVFR